MIATDCRWRGEKTSSSVANSPHTLHYRMSSSECDARNVDDVDGAIVRGDAYHASNKANSRWRGAGE